MSVLIVEPISCPVCDMPLAVTVEDTYGPPTQAHKTCPHCGAVCVWAVDRVGHGYSIGDLIEVNGQPAASSEVIT